MFRSYYLTFEARPPTDAHQQHVRESPRVMTWRCSCAGGARRSSSGRSARWLGRLGDAHEALSRQMLGPHARVGGAGDARLGGRRARSTRTRAEHAEICARPTGCATRSLHAFAFDTFRIDELYEATFVRGFHALARAAAWLDDVVVDGVVATVRRRDRARAAWVTGAHRRPPRRRRGQRRGRALLGGGRELRAAADGTRQPLRARRRRRRSCS